MLFVRHAGFKSTPFCNHNMHFFHTSDQRVQPLHIVGYHILHWVWNVNEIYPLAPKVVLKTKPLYMNATVVALTYACIQRHVSHIWNILFINGFNHITPYPSIWVLFGSWEIPVQCYSQKKIDENFAIPKWTFLV